MSRAILNLSIHDLRDLFKSFQWGLKYMLIDEYIWFLGEEDTGAEPPIYGLAIYDKHGSWIDYEDEDGDGGDAIVDEAIDTWIPINSVHDLKPLDTVTQMMTQSFTDIIINTIDV